MTQTVSLPMWLFVLILLFAAVTALSHVFIPPVRWFFRRRMQRVVDELNKRLQRPIQPFKLARRHDMIQRLIYDPAVIEAVLAHAKSTGLREDVAFSEAKRYAREIVPSFSASAYFGVAIRAARWLANQLYHVRLARVEEEGLANIDPGATVVFVMNHRSNMDYVLVTYLAAERSALSFAVGEWAQVWPLRSLIRAMGAYFIRRRERNQLYRRVLARYVQLATLGGVTQAIFPEGGLSLTGDVVPAKLGLLSYLVAGFDPQKNDLVFVPVSLNYDWVIEDRILVEAARKGERRFRGSFMTGTFFVLRWVGRRLRGQVRRFGYAAVSFGTPVSLKARHLGGDAGITVLGEELMARIRQSVPVLPVPLVAAALQSGATTRDEVTIWVAEAVKRFRARDVFVHLKRDDLDQSVATGVDMLVLREIVTETAGQLSIAEDKQDLLAFYAVSVLDVDAALQKTKPEIDIAAT